MPDDPEDDMADDEEELDEDDEPDLDDADLDEADLEGDEEFDDDLVDDEELVDEDVDRRVARTGEEPTRRASAVAATRPTKAGEEEGEEDDLEDVDPDDVEADLDTILKDRIAAADDEEDEEEDEVVDVDERGDTNKIQPRRPGEFVCQSCFLLKPRSQLADEKNQFCLDCV